MDKGRRVHELNGHRRAQQLIGLGRRRARRKEHEQRAQSLAPGGRVVVLEITTPTRPPLSALLRLWFDHIVPALGRLAGDPDAYEYLPSSVRRFPGPEQLAAILYESGLRDVGYRLTAGGIIALHFGTVPRR